MPQKFKECLLPSAEKDLDEILNYIAEALKNPQAAINLLNKIEETVENLCLYPESAPPHENPNLAIKGLRKFPVKNYMIHYYVNAKDSQLKILAIKYGGSDQNKIDTDFN